MDEDKRKLKALVFKMDFEDKPPLSESKLVRREKQRGYSQKKRDRDKLKKQEEQAAQQKKSNKKRKRNSSPIGLQADQNDAPEAGASFRANSISPQGGSHDAMDPSDSQSLVTNPRPSGFPVNLMGISPNAPDITWAGGFVTKAPWIDGTGRRQSVPNQLFEDEKYVSLLASQAMEASQCPLIDTVDFSIFKSATEFTHYVHERHGRGVYVVVNNFDETHVPLTADGLSSLALTLSTHAAVHSALRRATKKNLEQQDSYQTFLENLAKPDCVETILHCPDPLNAVDKRIALLDDGIQALNTMAKEQHERLLASDVTRARSWHLLHGSMYHTYPHHDAGGLSTWTIVRSGVKIWVVIVPKGYLNAKSYSNHLKHLSPFTVHERGSEYWQSNVGDACDRYAIIAGPGTLILQPPHAFHEVYTPNESVTSGGHFLTYDSLHLVALARLFDSGTGGITTNANHDYHFDIFVEMVRYLPENKMRRFRRKALTALCALVLYPARHSEKWSPDKWAETSARYLKEIRRTRRAKRTSIPFYDPMDVNKVTILPLVNQQAALFIIDALICKLSLKIDPKDSYLFKGDLMDPGEEVLIPEDVSSLSTVFLGYT